MNNKMYNNFHKLQLIKLYKIKDITPSFTTGIIKSIYTQALTQITLNICFVIKQPTISGINEKLGFLNTIFGLKPYFGSGLNPVVNDRETKKYSATHDFSRGIYYRTDKNPFKGFYELKNNI
jgi:hypothetical protein